MSPPPKPPCPPLGYTLAWKAIDDCLGKLAEAGEEMKVKYGAEPGAALFVAANLYLAEKLAAEFGDLRIGYEPLLSEFRAVGEWVQKYAVNAISEDVH